MQNRITRQETKNVLLRKAYLLSANEKKTNSPKKNRKKQYINQIIHTPKIKSQKKKFNILCGKFRKLIVGLKKIYILEILSKSVFIFL